MVRDCPRCGMINPPEAQRCDCGYDFAARQVRDSYLSPKELQSSNLPTGAPAFNVVRRVAFGVLWYFLFCLLAGVVMGVIVGFTAGARDPVSPAAAAERVGQEMMEKFGGLILVGAAVAAAAGTLTRVLPGTRSR